MGKENTAVREQVDRVFRTVVDQIMKRAESYELECDDAGILLHGTLSGSTVSA